MKTLIKKLFKSRERYEIRYIKVKKFDNFSIAALESVIHDPYRVSKGMLELNWVLVAFPNFDKINKLMISSNIYRSPKTVFKEAKKYRDNLKKSNLNLIPFKKGSILFKPPTEDKGKFYIRPDNEKDWDLGLDLYKPKNKPKKSKKR